MRSSLLLLVLAPALALPAQGPAPSHSERLAARGAALLEREDPVAALTVYRGVLASEPGDADGHLGLARAHLMLGRPAVARAHAEAVLARRPGDQQAMALVVRCAIRARRFDHALEVAERFVARVDGPGPALLATHASALFRVQRTGEAAATYRRVLALDPLHTEAHLRLGSGLSDPVPDPEREVLGPAVALLEEGELEPAIARLTGVLDAEPGHPIAHRLLGETLFLRRALTSMANDDPAFAALEALRPGVAVDARMATAFVPDYDGLRGDRRAVVDRALSWFATRIPRILTIGGRHDLLDELERTTDAPARRSLRGQRTFDGRVWDDVRGVGGLRAASGIEALDEAAVHGFDTLVHEIAHQVHFYALSMRDRLRIRELYRRAEEEGRFLDYYAATNEAEYFGQGVEAFASLGKRPAAEPTHGHTRFELRRLDPDLHDLIAGLVDRDPLADPARRARLLPAAVEVALRCGRPGDALEAARMMDPSPRRKALLGRARRAVLLARSY